MNVDAAAINNKGAAHVTCNSDKIWEDFIGSPSTWMYAHLFSKIYLLLSIQYPLNKSKIGLKLRAPIVVDVRVSPIAGGSLTM